jgi:hypothetical protein
MSVMRCIRIVHIRSATIKPQIRVNEAKSTKDARNMR